MSIANMGYTLKEFDWAIDLLLPDIKKAKELGQVFNRTDLIRMVAWKEFVGLYNLSSTGANSKIWINYPEAKHILQQASWDLEDFGSFKFKVEEEVW